MLDRCLRRLRTRTGESRPGSTQRQFALYVRRSFCRFRRRRRPRAPTFFFRFFCCFFRPSSFLLRPPRLASCLKLTLVLAEVASGNWGPPHRTYTVRTEVPTLPSPVPAWTEWPPAAEVLCCGRLGEVGINLQGRSSLGTATGSPHVRCGCVRQGGAVVRRRQERATDEP